MRKTIMAFALVLGLCAWGAAQQRNQSATMSITSGPSVSNVNGNSVHISWQTNRPSSSEVHYGTNPNNLNQTAKGYTSGTSHVVALSSLQPNQTYYFQVESEQPSGRGPEALSGIGQFQMNQQGQYGNAQYGQYGQNSQYGQYGQAYPANQNGQQRLPGEQASTRTDNVVVLAGPVVQNLTPNSATIWWQTDDRAATDVKYGLSPNQLDQRAYERGGDRNHTAELKNLQPGRTYYFNVLRRDGTIRTTGQFTTPQTNAYNSSGAQITNGPVMSSIGPNTAIVQWTTSTPTNSIVRFGSNPNSLSQTAQGQPGTTHQVQLSNLQPNTHYYFEVMSQDPNTGAMAQGMPGQFQTVGQGQQPVTIFGIPVTPR